MPRWRNDHQRLDVEPLDGQAVGPLRLAEPKADVQRRIGDGTLELGVRGWAEYQSHPWKGRPVALEDVGQAVGQDRLRRPDGERAGRLGAVRNGHARLV